LFKVEITSRARRELKKLSIPLKRRIIHEAGKLSENPELGKALSNPFVNIRSHHFTFEGSAYRLAYHVEYDERKIIVHLVAPRENFYEKLRRALNL